MRTGPSVECQGCGLPILLASAESEGAKRALTCPMCQHLHVWVINERRGAEAARVSRTKLGSSVE